MHVVNIILRKHAIFHLATQKTADRLLNQSLCCQRSEDDVRKFSSGSVISSSGTGEVYSELNGDESGDIVPWDDAMKSDMEKVMAAARLKASNHGNERPLVGVVSSNDDGHVEGIMYAVGE